MKKERKVLRNINEEVELLLMKISMITNHLISAKHGHERYKNPLEDEKQRLAEYRTKYYKIWKNKTASQVKTS